jgi:hypothetical protein
LPNDERKLQEEYEWVRSTYPEINIQAEMVTGVFLDELYAKAVEENTVLIIMGADGNYTELLSWDSNIVDAFIDLNIPVLVIPSTVSYHPVKKIAFALNYYRKNLQMPVSMIKRLVHFTNAQLSVINVVSPEEIIDETAKDHKRVLQESLAELAPTYHEPDSKTSLLPLINLQQKKILICSSLFQQDMGSGIRYFNRIILKVWLT